MSGAVHVVSASITSALAVKPSTVYVLRVENMHTRDVWHLRRCFSEFCDLRDQIAALLDGHTTASTAITSSSDTNTNTTSSTSTAASASTLAAMRMLSLNLASPSAGLSSPSPPSPSLSSSAHYSLSDVNERFPYLYSKFPRRQFFGSRSKKVIEQRSVGLNQFLQEALWLLREVRGQRRIAMTFSLTTQLESFLEVREHSSATANMSTSSSSSSNSPCDPAFTPQACATQQPGFAKLHTACCLFGSPEQDECNANSALEHQHQQWGDTQLERTARAVAARGFGCSGPLDEEDDEDNEEIEEEEPQLLKKTISCFMEREVRERQRAAAPAQLLRASERDQRVTAADAWAARIEIAGIPRDVALHQRQQRELQHEQQQQHRELPVDRVALSHW